MRCFLRTPNVLERQGLPLNFLLKLVVSLILETHFVVLEYFRACLKAFEQLWCCSLLNCWLHWQGRTQRGVGLKKPLSLIFYKNFITCAKEINCFRILFACQFVDLIQILRNKFACKCLGILCMDQKVIISFWWGSGLSSASTNRLITFCRPFVNYAFLRLCSAMVHFIRNNCLYFVC